MTTTCPRAARPSRSPTRSTGTARGEVCPAPRGGALGVFASKTEGPIVVAGHSQGSALGARLVRDRIVGSAEAERLVVAYLIGGPVREDVGLPVCESATQTGCLVGWNARSAEYVPNRLEFDGLLDDPMGGRVCVNPLTWTSDGVADASDHGGAVFFDVAEPAVEPEFVGAACRDGALVITEPGDMGRDAASRVLLKMMGPGNYHPVEYQLFYVDLRRNALERVEAFEARR